MGWHRSGLKRAVLALSFLFVPGLALAATVTVKGRLSGQQKLLNPVWNEAKDPNAKRYSFREPSPTVKLEARTLTGYLPKELCVVALGEKGTAQKVPYKVTIAGGRTTPVTLVVPEGQAVQFENRDPFTHRIYDTENKGLQKGDTPTGKNRTWTPPGPGRYEIRDELAPSLRSWIVVEPRTIATTYPDRKGEFSLSLEPGDYKLRGYFNGQPVGVEIDVTVGNTPAEQNLKQALPVAEPTPADAGTGG